MKKLFVLFFAVMLVSCKKNELDIMHNLGVTTEYTIDSARSYIDGERSLEVSEVLSITPNPKWNDEIKFGIFFVSLRNTQFRRKTKKILYEKIHDNSNSLSIRT